MWSILFILIIIYSLSSWIFLRYPHLLHKKLRQPSFKHRIVAHRGGKGEEVEQTLSAFRLAAENGADMLEMDLQMTRDGEIIVFHDDSLSRMCLVDKDIEDVDYADLPCLITDPTDPHSYLGKATGDPDQCHIPKFEEVLKACPNTPFVIELKHRGTGQFNRHAEFVDKVSTLLKKYNHHDNCVLGSRFEPTHSFLKAALPDCFFYYSAQKLLLIVASYWLGFLPFLHLPDVFCMTPIYAHVDERFERFIPGGSIITRIMGGFPQITITMTHKKLIKHMHRRGIILVVFGDRWGSLNTHDEFNDALELGLNVCTNYPRLLKEYIDNK